MLVSLYQSQTVINFPLIDVVLSNSYFTLFCLPLELGESTKLNDENNFCFHFGMISDGNGDESRYPEDLSSFLALLESIPLQYAESSFGSFEHVKPDMRYDRIFLCLSSLPLSSVNIVWESFVSF